MALCCWAHGPFWSNQASLMLPPSPRPRAVHHGHSAAAWGGAVGAWLVAQNLWPKGGSQTPWADVVPQCNQRPGCGGQAAWLGAWGEQMRPISPDQDPSARSKHAVCASCQGRIGAVTLHNEAHNNCVGSID